MKRLGFVGVSESWGKDSLPPSHTRSPGRHATQLQQSEGFRSFDIDRSLESVNLSTRFPSFLANRKAHNTPAERVTFSRDVSLMTRRGTHEPNRTGQLVQHTLIDCLLQQLVEHAQVHVPVGLSECHLHRRAVGEPGQDLQDRRLRLFKAAGRLRPHNALAELFGRWQVPATRAGAAFDSGVMLPGFTRDRQLLPPGP